MAGRMWKRRVSVGSGLAARQPRDCVIARHDPSLCALNCLARAIVVGLKLSINGVQVPITFFVSGRLTCEVLSGGTQV